MEATAQGLAGIWEALEAYLAAEQIELDDLELIGRGRTRTLRILIDGNNLDLDRIAETSRGLSRLLDSLDHPVLETPYQLEVTSPGLERKLTRPRHYQKSVGREVIVKTERGSHRGVLRAATDADFTISGAEPGATFTYSDVISARTVFTWEKPAKPGHRRTDEN